MKKLTLSADPDVIEQAHRLAKQNGTSLSSMFERFVRLLGRGGKGSRRVGPLTRRATGIASLPPRKTSRRVLEDALLDKHGLRR